MSSTHTRQHLICPIALELFIDPVIAEDGNTYERNAITQWIHQHGTSPITKKPINIDRLTPNHTIKDSIAYFKQQQTRENAEPSTPIPGANVNNENYRSLDVLCVHCGLTQKFSSIREHKLQCPSNPENVERFEIAENEIAFASSQQASSTKTFFHRGKKFSFANPLAPRPANQMTTESSLQTQASQNTLNKTNVELTRESRFSLLKNKNIKCSLLILLIITLVTIIITLTVYYIKCKEKPFPTETTRTSIFTSIFTLTSTSTLAITSPSTSTATAISTSTATSISTSTPTSISTSTATSTSTSTATSISTSTATSTSTSTATSTSTFTATLTSTSTSTVEMTTSSTMTSTLSSTSQILCFFAEWDPNGITVASNLYDPQDVAIDSNDNLIVADTENRRLQKYLTNGTNITLLTNIKVSSVFIDQLDNIYVTDTLGDQVKKLSSIDQSLAIVAGSDGSGSALDQLVLDGQPGIYIDRNFSLYVSDTGNHRVMKYPLNATSGIVVAGGHGQGPDLNQLNAPYGIYVDEVNEIGAVYICDTQNHRIQKWLPNAIEGVTVALNEDQLHSPNSILLSIASDQTMIMYISSFTLHHILKWIPYSEQAETIVAGIGSGVGTDANQLFASRGIKFDKNWNLFVADTGNDRIQKFLFNISSCQNDS